MKLFKGESIVYNLLCEYYGKENILVNYRPDWLKNPQTGHNLELDFYIEKEHTAFEVQGPHHYVDKAQKARDYIKRKVCKERGICLIEVKADENDFYTLRHILRSTANHTAMTYGRKKRRKKSPRPTFRARMMAAKIAQQIETESVRRRNGEAAALD